MYIKYLGKKKKGDRMTNVIAVEELEINTT